MPYELKKKEPPDPDKLAAEAADILGNAEVIMKLRRCMNTHTNLTINHRDAKRILDMLQLFAHEAMRKVPNDTQDPGERERGTEGPST